MSERRVVVVGGGLAGLSAAITCAERGASVTLLEKAPRLGGATWSFRRKGVWYDNGQHVFLRCCTQYRAFLETLGVSDRVVLQRRLDVPVLSPDGRRGRIYRVGGPAPLHLLPALTTYRLLPARHRARVAVTAMRLGRLSPEDPALDERTFGEWLTEQSQPPAAIEALWNLISLPTLNLPATDASLALATKVFRTGLLDTSDGSDLGYARVPLSALHADPGEDKLRALGATVRASIEVSRIEKDDSGFTVRAGGEVIPADAVVVAVSHHQAAALLEPLGIPGADRLSELGSSPILNLHFHFDRRVFHQPLAAVIDSPVQWMFDRTVPSGVDGGQVLAVSLSAATDFMPLRPAELRRDFTAELKRLLPGAAHASVLDFVVTRERHATFRQAPGTARLRPGARTSLPGLVLGGAWTDTGWPATMEGAVRSGIAAAREALIHIGATRRLPAEVAS